ncbi:glucose-6-phosphate isomerase, partial [Salmonella enterica]|nr:glucose-6-phosphate isomerase [Salmonella enterica]
MLSQLKPDLNTETVCQKLASSKEQLDAVHLRELFAADPQRFNKYSIQFKQLVFDYSKHRMNSTVMQGLIEWADAQNLRSWIGSLFSNQAINYTEQRAAMHWALRLPAQDQQHADLAADV